MAAASPWLRRTRRRLAPMGGVLAALCGCAAPEPPPPAPTPGIYPVQARRYETPPPIADSRAVHDMIQDLKGRVVLLSFWTRFSERPRQDLRDLTDLQRGRYARGLRVIACNTDDPADWSEYTRPLLLSAGANFTCVIISDSSREALRNWLNPSWNYEMPAWFLFNSQGARVGSYIASQAAVGAVGQVIDDLLSGGASAWTGQRTGAATAEPAMGGQEDSPGAAGGAGDPSGMRASAGQSRQLVWIDVARGAATPIGQRVSLDDPDSIDAVANDAARRVSAAGARLGVLPMAGGGHDPMTERLVRSLRLAGLRAVEPPDVCQRRLTELSLSPAAVAEDPSVLRGKWEIDYLILAR